MIAGGQISAAPGRPGNKDACSLSKSWSCQKCTHGLDSDLILGYWGRTVAVFPVIPWHPCVPGPPTGIERCVTEALTGSSIHEAKNTWW